MTYEIIKCGDRDIIIKNNTIEQYDKKIGDLWTAIVIIKPGVVDKEDIVVGLGIHEPDAKTDAVSKARKLINSNLNK